MPTEPGETSGSADGPPPDGVPEALWAEVYDDLRRLAARPRSALQGIVVTLKLDDWRALRHLPRWRRQIEAMGMVEVGVKQLSSNRMELFSYGLTRAGVARRGASAAGAPGPSGRGARGSGGRRAVGRR